MSEYIIGWDENLVIDTFSKNSLREEIVRCRDCCCCHTVEGREWCVRHNIAISPGAFCAWGERRSDD